MRHLYALIVGTGLCVPSLALAEAPAQQVQRPVAAVTSQSVAQQQTTARQQTVSNDRARYAEKETQSGDAQNYKGGDTVVIGASAAVAILAVLLVLVLI
jgi:hypothetical protein